MRTDEVSSILVLAKIGQVLDYISLDRGSTSVSEMSRQLKIARPTLHRILDALVAEGILTRQEGRYSPGLRLVQWGSRALQSQSLAEIGGTVLHDLVQRTGETASLFVRIKAIRVCVARVEGAGLLRHHIAVGEPLPLYAGSAGHTLLAWMDPGVREGIWAESIGFFHPPAPLEPPVDRWQEIRDKRFAISLGERDSALASVSVPVFDAQQAVRAAVTLSGPISRFLPGVLTVMVQELTVAAHEIETRLLADASSGDPPQRKTR
ncbi:MAG: IclR family transcriptional regulator [Thermaerobacter sp.]|nr:IclR family transcriptional regulator [Thermaerobacter sp.]